VGDQEDAFERVRREPDPVRQARLAGELISLYQQRSVELARLRREAINRAAEQKGISFSAIAAQLGLTRGRISQIRQTAPPAERALFGVGPVTVAVPLRQVPRRALPVISSEDSQAAERLTQLLTDLAFQVHQFRIPPDGRWQPTGDTVAICGPKSSTVTEEAIRSDPFLTFEPDAQGRWAIRERDGSRVYVSPMDEGDDVWADVAYVGRLAYRKQELLVIAGIHALGSVGAIEYLSRELPEVYAAAGTRRFSMVVRSQHEGEQVVGSELVCPPRAHE
jgi:transcriptional regulator with XRE-family HTH domain